MAGKLSRPKRHRESMVADETSSAKGACDFDGRAEKNRAKGLATGVGRIPGKALRIFTETYGGSHFRWRKSHEVLKLEYASIC